MYVPKRAHCRGSRPTTRLTVLVLSALLVPMLLSGCGEAPTPTPPPVPTRRPTATPPPESVLDEARFVLRIDDALYATEVIRVDRSAEQLVVFSEMQLVGQGEPIQRRTLVLSGARGPQRYDMETLWAGARSTWAAERATNGTHCLNNNLDWHAPTLFEGLTPAADFLIESAPSALPFALLALEYDDDIAAEPLALHALDVTKDLPESHPMAVSVAADRTGAVIGTVALEVRIEGSANPVYTLWLRPGNKALYGVEAPDFRFGPWQRGYGRELPQGTLKIERVRQFPEEVTEEEPSTAKARTEPFEFAAGDGTLLSGSLTLPVGTGPFPCVLAHSPGGPVPRWTTLAPFIEAGWAVCAYDKRGIGESEGTYRRDAFGRLADDVQSAAAALRAHDEIGEQQIVFLGYGQGGVVGALALAEREASAAGAPLAGAILGNCAAEGTLFPDLVDAQIDALLAPAYGWAPHQIAAYREASTRAWQDWLFEGEDEVRLLGRRASLAALQDAAEIELGALLETSEVPVLLLHETGCARYPIESARRAAAAAVQASPERITWREIETEPDLAAIEDGYARLSEDEVAVILAWLEAIGQR